MGVMSPCSLCREQEYSNALGPTLFISRGRLEIYELLACFHLSLTLSVCPSLSLSCYSFSFTSSYFLGAVHLVTRLRFNE